MRKTILVLLTLLLVPTWTFSAPKHGQRLQKKVQELGHKKRMKKAAKPESDGKQLLIKKHSHG